MFQFSLKYFSGAINEVKIAIVPENNTVVLGGLGTLVFYSCYTEIPAAIRHIIGEHIFSHNSPCCSRLSAQMLQKGASSLYFLRQIQDFDMLGRMKAHNLNPRLFAATMLGDFLNRALFGIRYIIVTSANVIVPALRSNIGRRFHHFIIVVIVASVFDPAGMIIYVLIQGNSVSPGLYSVVYHSANRILTGKRYILEQFAFKSNQRILRNVLKNLLGAYRDRYLFWRNLLIRGSFAIELLLSHIVKDILRRCQICRSTFRKFLEYGLASFR